MNLVGVTEIGRMLGVSRQRADQLTRHYSDFPVPVAELASGRVWLLEDVERWIAQHPDRPTGRPRKAGGL